MAAKHKLYYNVRKGNISAEEIKEKLRFQGLKVASVNLYSNGFTGVVAFQKKADRDAVLATGFLNLDETLLTVMEQDPRRGLPPQKKATASLGPVFPSLNSKAGDTHQTTSKFFNPYHFVDVEGFTPRYKIIPHDRFSHHCGRIEAELEFITPGFIPDPEKTTYIINDETLLQGDENKDRTDRIQTTIENWLAKNGMNAGSLPVDILFDPDCRSWDSENADKHLKSAGKDDHRPEGFHKGQIFIDQEKRYFIETSEPNRRAHKVMDFFSIGDKPAIPSTSLKGMLRNTVEILSNSCFTGYGDEDRTEHMFHRLDVQNDNRELRGLKAVILKKKVDGEWGYIQLDQAKVLSPHLFNRIGGSGENALGAYLNQENPASTYYEKISVEGKYDDRDINRCSGLNAYDRRKRGRGRIVDISEPFEIDTSAFAVTKIKTVPLTHSENVYKKTFPYVSSVPNPTELWAIVRRKQLNFSLYKIKVISDKKENLEKALPGFVKGAMKMENEPNLVEYAISKIKIKTAFDIDTKTQHRAFFLFGKKEFDEAVTKKFDRNPQGFGENEKTIISQFRSLLRQRKENAKKLPHDPQGINKALAGAMPEDVYDGMLAYYHPSNKYLTYTTVPQKPYETSPRAILEKLDKLPCKRLDRLCPACQLFGTVVPRNDANSEGSKMPGGYKGKVTVGMGKFTKPGDRDPGTITIRPLGTPKPTYYPFYVTNNRRKTQQHQPSFMDYDRQEIRTGRKVYLHQEPEKLHYQTDQKTNLNATIHPVPGGTRFKFEITFENLTNCELGLLLYSLDMEYKTKEVGYHLGMGKSLGLGSCRLKLGTVTLYDMVEHYKSLEGGHGAALKNLELQRLELIYQYVQGTNEKKTFYQRLDNVNNGKFGDISLPDDSTIIQDYLDQKYIREFHILKSINVQPGLKLNLPVHFAGGMETEAFRWYQAARSNQSQRLFEPDALEKDAQQGNKLEEYALAP